MERFFFTGLLIPLILIGLVIFGIVQLARRSGEDSEDPGIGALRRVFYYGLAFVALMVASTGLTLLLGMAFESVERDVVLGDMTGRAAGGLSAVIVGIPIWLLFWRSAQRSVQSHATERGTLGRKSYLYLVLGASAAVAAAGAVQFLSEVIGGDFDGTALGVVIVWSALWALHWRWENVEGQPTAIARSTRRVYTYVTSGYAVVLLATGIALLLSRLLTAAYDAIFTSTVVTRPLWNDQLQSAVALAAVGALWWAFHWHRVARGDILAMLRQVNVYFLGVFGGVVTVVTALAIGLVTALQWAFASDSFAPAPSHFDVLPKTLAAVIAGAAIWGYHAAVAAQESGEVDTRRISARRAYRYLTSGVGIGTASAGMALLIAVLVGFIIPAAQPDAFSGTWWATPLASALALLAAGTPLWAFHWSRQQQVASTGEQGERGALARRIYVFAIFGAATLAVIAAAATLLTLVLEPLLSGELSADVLDDGKWTIGVLLAAAAVSGYHWQVLREDRAVEPEAPTAPSPAKGAETTAPSRAAPFGRPITAVAPEAARPFVSALAGVLNTPIRFLPRLDEEGDVPSNLDAEVNATAENIRLSPADEILLLVDESGVQLIPCGGGNALA